MLKQIIRIFFCLVLTLMLSMQSYGDDQFDQLEIHTRLNNLVEKKVDYYRQLYPDISFLILKGGDELVTDMMALDKALGVEPKSLDYEHPPALREKLMFVSAIVFCKCCNIKCHLPHFLKPMTLKDCKKISVS